MTTGSWDSFIAAIIGALIGGGFVLLGVRWEHRNNLKLHAFQQRKRIRGVLQAIRYELEILGKVYQDQAGGLVETLAEGTPFTVYFSLTEKYFIVYPANTEIVGQIDDAVLCRSIVVTYNKANFLLECFRINNWYLDKLSECRRLQAQNPLDPYANTNICALQPRLVEWCVYLKQAHGELKRETDNLFAKIEDYLRRHPVEIDDSSTLH